MMDSFGHAIASFLLLLIITLASADNPGVKIRATNKGITYVNTVAQAALRQKLSETRIPDQSGSGRRFSWSISNIHSEGIAFPSTNIALNPGNNGLTLSVSNFGVNMRADWRASYKLLFTFRGSGSVDLDISGASISVTVGLGEKAGRLSVSSRSCNCQIGHVGVRLHGGLVAFIVNLFRGTVADRIKNLMQSKICEIVNNYINNNADNELSKMKVLVDIGQHFILDYSLVSVPAVTGNYLETQNKGQVFWRGDQRESPFSANVIPYWNDFDNMLYVWITEYSANTFTHVAHSHGFLKYNITVNDLPTGKSNVLNPTPQIAAVYPNSKLELRIRSISAPTVKISNGNLTVTAFGDVEVVDYTQSGTPSFLTLSVNVSLTVQPSIVNGRLLATIGGYRFDVGVQRSDIGPIDQQELNTLISQSLDSVVIPGLNNIGKYGLDLPTTRGDVSFYNTKLILQAGVLIASTDVRYL